MSNSTPSSRSKSPNAKIEKPVSKGSSSGSRPRTTTTVISEKVTIEGLKKAMKLSLPEGGPRNRKEYVEYALNMIVHNLIGSGQLNASKAHLVRTNEMRAHISRLADRVEAAQRAGIPSQIASRSRQGQATAGTKWAMQPNSLPITIITDRNPTVKSRPKSRAVENSRKTRTEPNLQERKPRNVLKVPIASQRKRSTSSGYGQRPKKTNTTVGRNLFPKRNPPVTIIQTAKTLGEQSVSRIAVNYKEAEMFQIIFDMRGFSNDEISLDLKGRTLTVTGSRQRREGLNARKTTETIEIPAGINLDLLKVARKPDGQLVIQETNAVSAESVHPLPVIQATN